MRALKVESPAEGGTQNDATFGPTEVDIGQDFLDAQGVSFQRPSANTQTADSKVLLSRTAADDMTLSDPNAGLLALQQLITSVSGRIGSHNAIAGLEHWTGNPGDAYASGAYMTVSQSGILPTLITWYASSASSAAKLFEVAVTYTGMRPATITQRLYVKNAVIRTYVDTLTYNNVFFPSVVRTYA
ncbi:MAG: hypothetical protein EOO38_00010 [Cytophagaceae bacterium]|nr:MAG: hypothetical protein EOO38_00010 [Cytophagaceae bacterium]